MAGADLRRCTGQLILHAAQAGLFRGGRWYLLGAVVARDLVLCRFSVSKLLRYLELQLGDGHNPGVAWPLRCSPGKSVGPLIAFMTFHPHQVDGFAPTSQVAHHVPGAAGGPLSRARPSVARSGDGACGVRMYDHVLSFGPLEPGNNLLNRRKLRIERGLLVANVA
jgi:hypothetical protein